MLLNDYLARANRLYANLPALVDGDVRHTYGELNDRVHRLAAGLQGLGLQHGDHLAILSHNSHRYMEVYLASSLAGLVLSPINTRLTAREAAFILEDAEVKALLVGREFLPLLAEIRGDLNHLDQVILLDGIEGDRAEGKGTALEGMEERPQGEVLTGYEEMVSSADPRALKTRDWREDDMVFLCYTGGTTGFPKGVMLSQRNVVANVNHSIQVTELNERDVWLHVCPMFHAADYWSCFAFTGLGSFHVFQEKFDPRVTLELVEKYRVNVLMLVPTMINMVLELPDAGSHDLSCIRRVMYGASPMPVERLKLAFQLFGPNLQQFYGQTETSPFLTAMTMRGTVLDGSENEVRRLASCGQELLGLEVRVVDGEGNPIQPGEVGEITARGPNVMLGYWKRPEETASTLRGGWVHTGDMATVDEENYIFILDRAKDMIITGGENVYCPEVENVLYKHPEVVEAAIIGIPDEKWGELVKGIVVLQPGAKVDESGLIEHCHQWIAGYKSPKSIDIIDALPKSGAGKILKSELRKPYWEGQERAVN